jgi:hypothetical protein
MRSALLFKLPKSRIKSVVCLTIFVTSISVVSIFHGKPSVWPVAEVPVAFWAWRTQAPDPVDIREAIEKTKARAIFLRAGQIDYHDGKLRRIRPLTGSLPHGLELHLVYNATPALLRQLEHVDPKTLATTIGAAYVDDLERARGDNAAVSGIQLDIDVPTRLLPRYGKTLSELRRNLEQGKQLSITGLPTWVESTELDNVLQTVDFWVPQFYGAEIPQRIDQIIPISSPENLTYFINKVRQIDRPFYAGLAAYSFALLYSSSGSLINLRGDMDPASIARDPNLELIDQRSFYADGHVGPTMEWRSAFRAKADGVVDGLNMRAGDVLVVDVPSSESLRVAARIVRDLAGKKLLGICIFRLPARTDQATLTIEQVQSALNDHDSISRIDVRIKRDKTNPRTLFLECKNAGTTTSLVGSLKVDLAVPPGSVATTAAEAGVLVEPMCEGLNAGPQPCSERRASLVRFTARVLAPGRTFSAMVTLDREPPATATVSITMKTDAGQSYSIKREISTKTE